MLLDSVKLSKLLDLWLDGSGLDAFEMWKKVFDFLEERSDFEVDNFRIWFKFDFLGDLLHLLVEKRGERDQVIFC